MELGGKCHSCRRSRGVARFRVFLIRAWCVCVDTGLEHGETVVVCSSVTAANLARVEAESGRTATATDRCARSDHAS